ncbi:MAG: cell wall-binding protein [Lachnospiraceae bacterium]|jgi:glucan-binding YG repeat protein|nr:cell wall-binding protein [Lachnospiraceae bacterium]
MKKKSLASLTLIAIWVFALCTITSTAAEGWQQQNGNWVYENADGALARNEWKKGADNLFRYLDSTGYMVINAWVEDDYYMDEDGILVTSNWKKLPDLSGESDENVWYYFSSSGKKVVDSWKKIGDKWYYFNEYGVMQVGWVQDNTYYTGSDGAMRTGWQKLTPPAQEDEDRRTTPTDSSSDGKYWYYFLSDGRKYVPDLDGGADYGEKKIDGVNYCFDENGAMQTGWLNLASSGDDTDIANYRYYGEDGQVITGWYATYPPDEIDGYDYLVEWFYFERTGAPRVGPAEGDATVKDIKKIGSNSYLFNPYGTPVFGLQKVYLDDEYQDYTAYYFGARSASCVQKGKITIEEGDGTKTQFYFADSGRGYTGVKDSYLYYRGKLQKAESGTKYQVISIPSDTEGEYANYVVNVSGKVSKSANVKDADGVKYTTNASGILTKVDDVEVEKTLYNRPQEPVWKE